jgi:hypothetical protein
LPIAKFRGRLVNRRTIILREPILKRFLGSIVFPGGIELDNELDRLTEEKLKEWEAMGVPPGMRSMALELAREWAAKMAEFAAPGMPDIQRSILPGLYKKGLDVADRWVRSLRAAATALQ